MVFDDEAIFSQDTYKPQELLTFEQIEEIPDALDPNQINALDTSEEPARDEEEEDPNTIVVNTSHLQKKTAAQLQEKEKNKDNQIPTLPTPETTPEPASNPIPDSAPGPAHILAEFSTDNILPEGTRRQRRPRHNAYFTITADTKELSEFHSAFSAAIATSNELNPHRLYRDTLPLEPQSWKQLISHPFADGFKKAA